MNVCTDANNIELCWELGVSRDSTFTGRTKGEAFFYFFCIKLFLRTCKVNIRYFFLLNYSILFFKRF